MTTTAQQQKITRTYEIDGNVITVTRRWVNEAYARNGNVANPTQYYLYYSTLNGENVTDYCKRSADAYEHARAKLLGIDYFPGVGPTDQGARNVRPHWVVTDEMKANYTGMTRHD